MNGHTINQILRTNSKTSRIFKGCFPCNSIPTNDLKKSIFIVNLDPEGMKGSHWITIFVNLNKVYYFDSLALPISNCIFNSFLKIFPTVVHNIKAYQSPIAKTCAHHCISLTYFLSQGISFEEYLKILNTKQNPDLFVLKIVNKILK